MADYGFIAQGADPMAQVGKIAAVQNQVNQNRLFQGEVAAGRALQAAVDPQTGQVDFAKARGLLAGDPATAPFALEAMNKLLSGQGQSITNTTGQTNLQSLYATNLRKVIASVAPSPQGQPDDRPQRVLGAITRGASQGLYPADFASGFVGGVPLSDGATFKELAAQAAIANGDQASMAAQFGAPGTVETGGKDIAVSTNPVIHERVEMGGDAGAVNKTLSPEAKATRQTIVQGGVEKTVPTSALVTDEGEPKTSALTGPSGEVQARLTPAQTAAGTATGTGYGSMDVGLTQRASKVADNKALLGNMEGLLDQFTPGPQSGFWKGVNQLATQYGLAPPGSPPANKAAAQEEFGKLSFQLAQSQFQALGGTGTDAKLDSTMHTSPSELLTRYGSKGIIALLKGNEDAIKAQNAAWQKWKAAGHGPETYDQFQAQWNQHFDPRVFQAQYMTPDARQTMLKGMTGAEQAQFKKVYNNAVRWGWIAQ